MPQYEVMLRYRLEWTASIVVTAKNEEAAQEKVEKQFDQVFDYSSFERFIAEDSTPQLDEESLEIESIDQI